MLPARRETRPFNHGKGNPMEHDEKKANEEQTEQRDEMDDLDVSQQQAEDVKGGKRGGRWPRPRGE